MTNIAQEISCLSIKIASKSCCLKAWKTLGKWDVNIGYNYEKDVGYVNSLRN
jgi:hypothetical protein